MANILTNTTFATSYKDDFADSDHYHRILFNAGRALQARELTQMQTIIQKEIERFGSHVFNEGGIVRAGNITLNTTYEYIKLNDISKTYVSNSLVGLVYTVRDNPNIRVRILEVKTATDTDPATLYVQYEDTTGGTPGAAAVRVPNNVWLESTQNAIELRVAASDATGKATTISVKDGDFFVQGHFVFVKSQTIFVDKYSNTPSSDIGFRLVEDIVTVDDTNDLYDNQGAVPNIASPGADRHRIRLTLIKKSDLRPTENFVYLCRVDQGKIVDESSYNQTYNVLQDVMATRTKEESGDYVVKPFIAKFNDLNDSNLQLAVTSGVAYVDGYRLDIPASKITVPKAQETFSFASQNIVATYGNYVIGNGTNNKGLPNINEFEEVTLNNAANFAGSGIGTARVRAVEEHTGNNYKYYLMDIQMNSGQVLGSVRSFGTSTTDYTNIVLEGGDAILRSGENNSLLFPLPKTKPGSTGVSITALTVQRRYIFQTDANGDKQLLSTDGDTVGLTFGHGAGTFTNSGDWIVSTLDGAITSANYSNLGTTVDISGLTGNTTYELLAYVAVDTPAPSTKQLNQNQIITKAWPTEAESDGNGTRWIDLGVPDVYRVNAIKRIDSDGADLSTNFIFDNGQRDNFYAKGRLIEKTGTSIPSGNVYVKYDHFTINSKKNFFSVNSYDQVVNYEDIPTHTKANGEVVNLRDVLDFRSYQNDSANYTHGTGIHHLPQNTDVITGSVEYYMPRKDRLVASVTNHRDGRIGKGDLKVIQGVPSLNPQFPEIPTGSIPLYDIELNAYTVNLSDVKTSFYDNRRYTMKDIARLEKRIDDLTELTTLSLLEANTSTYDVFDSDGLSRTKAGFIADAFSNYRFSNTTSSEYRATVNTLNNTLRPEIHANNVRLLWDSATSVAANTVRKGDLALLAIDSNLPFIEQLLATGTDEVNPFNVITQTGFIELSPASDTWVEINFQPDTIIDGGEITELVGARLVNDINNFEASWFGVPSGGAVQVVTGSTVLRDIIGERVLDISIIPFMRSRKISFDAHGLRPNTRVYPFFDGINISNYTRAESFVRVSETTDDVGNLYTNTTSHPDGSTSLITDSAGSIAGSFIIPSNDNLKFRTGNVLFKLLDIDTDQEALSATQARATFSAQGAIETRSGTVRTTRVLELEWIENLLDVDPLAQTFRIDQFEHPNGLFLTKVDVFFRTKDQVGIPIKCEIRTVENGVPTEQALPGATTYLLPSQVTTPTDEGLNPNSLTDIVQAATTFTFAEPVFLNSGQQYAIVLMAESTAYTVYTAQVLEFLLGSTEAKVQKQPTLGSLFISQNATTWTAEQTKDLMFRLYRAQFASSGSITLNNSPIANKLLTANPIQTTSGSDLVRVFNDGHGLSKGDAVTISGLDLQDSYGGIRGTSLAGSRTVLNVDHTGFTFTADSDADATIRVGGNAVVIGQNAIFNSYVPTVTTLLPENVTLASKVKLTGSSAGTGVLSYANRRNLGPTLDRDTTFTTITLNEVNQTEEPKAILSDSNETFHLSGDKSFLMQLDLTTTDDRVSPIIDLQRTAVTTFENLIDRQSPSASTNFNIPLTYVAETDPVSGSSPAKHVTSVITLAEAAVGLKIILSANRPTNANFEVYYKIGTTDDNFDEVDWVLLASENNPPADNDGITFRDYEYLAGGPGGTLSAFTKYQVKIVMTSTNSSEIPVFKDLRAIALVT
jgi:hypothetical protein